MAAIFRADMRVVLRAQLPAQIIQCNSQLIASQKRPAFDHGPVRDTANGNARWTKNLSSSVGVGVDERFVFAADEHGVLTTYARDSGSSVWTSKLLENRGLSAPISFGRAVVVGDAQGYIHFLSREDGSMLARVATDGSPLATTPAIAGANVIFQTHSGSVVAYAAE